MTNSEEKRVKTLSYATYTNRAADLLGKASASKVFSNVDLTVKNGSVVPKEAVRVHSAVVDPEVQQ